MATDSSGGVDIEEAVGWFAVPQERLERSRLLRGDAATHYEDVVEQWHLLRSPEDEQALCGFSARGKAPRPWAFGWIKATCGTCLEGADLGT